LRGALLSAEAAFGRRRMRRSNPYFVSVPTWIAPLRSQ
jgi:hypothetical protein